MLYDCFSTDVILELVQILEDCELKASDKVKRMQSDNIKLKTKLENLKNQIQTNSEEHVKGKIIIFTQYILFFFLPFLKCRMVFNKKKL